MNNNLSIGRLGEEIAARYLLDRGFKIIERNFRRPWGELDIIAQAKDKTLVFVEVKTMKTDAGRSSADSISPEDNMNKSKLRKTRKIAAMYANGHPESIDESRGWRIDLIAITIKVPREMNIFDKTMPLTEIVKHCEINYIENVE